MILLDIIVGSTVKDGLPTAERILNDHLWMGTEPTESQSAILAAMQSYSDQQNAGLMSEIEKWKEVSELGKKSIRELIKANEKLESVESENAELREQNRKNQSRWAKDRVAQDKKHDADMMEACGKIVDLEERVKELEATDPAQVVLAEGYHRLQSENERLRDTLENRIKELEEAIKVMKSAIQFTQNEVYSELKNVKK